MYRSVMEYTRDMLSNKSRTICTQIRCPTMFAKMPFGFRPLEVNLIEQPGPVLKFVLGTIMKAEGRLSVKQGNYYLTRRVQILNCDGVLFTSDS